MVVIIFFALLFIGCMLYYLRYVLNYLMHKYNHPSPKKQQVHVIRTEVLPVDYKIDFKLDERMFKYEAEKRRMFASAVAREYAARRLSNEVYDMVIKDCYNQLFNLLEHDNRMLVNYEREKYFTIKFSIIPQFNNERNCQYGSKLI